MQALLEIHAEAGVAHIGGLLEEHKLWGVSIGWLGNLEQLAQREGKCLQARELLILEAVPGVDVLIPLACVSERISTEAGRYALHTFHGICDTVLHMLWQHTCLGTVAQHCQAAEAKACIDVTIQAPT